MRPESRPTPMQLAWSRTRLGSRYVTAIVLATIAGGVVWLVGFNLLEEAGVISVQFARAVALELGVEGRRQTVGVAGLGLTLAAYLVIVLTHAAFFERRFEPRDRESKGTPVTVRAMPASVLNLAIAGFVAAPLIGAGVLGLSDGTGMFVSLVVMSAAASICAVRVYSLVITPRWWEPKAEGVAHAFAEQPPPSLELPEQGREEGGEGARR